MSTMSPGFAAMHGGISELDLAGLLEAARRDHGAGDLPRARAGYRQILAAQPDHAEAVHLLGVAAHQAGDDAGAVDLMRRSIALQDRNPAFHGNLAAVLIGLGQLADAVPVLRALLALNPDDPAARKRLARALACLGRHGEAEAACRAALELAPGDAELHNDLGAALAGLGRLDQAIEAYRAAVGRKAEFPEALSNLGAALAARGRYRDAEAAYRGALAIRPDYAEALTNLAAVLATLGRRADALAAARRALSIDPGLAEAHNNLGLLLAADGQLDAAAGAYGRAVELKPDYAGAWNNLAGLHKDRGELPAALAAYRRALDHKANFAAAHGNLLLCMSHDPATTPHALHAESRRWDALHAAPLATSGAAAARLPGNEPSRDRRLRVGYLSPDFRKHSVAFFVEPLLAAHDRARVEVVCYGEVRNPDGVTARLRGLADRWRSTVGMTDAEVARLIRDDRIDVLVDLAGHTADNRLLALAERPAPVQVTWLGYGATTGMTAVDYRLSDAVADPEGEADRVHSETLVRLPCGFLCYRPPADAPEVADMPLRAAGAVTFGSFNNLAKITPEVVATWARLLRRVPGARLLIKSQRANDPAFNGRLLDLFVGQGVGRARVRFMAPRPSIRAHLAAYGEVDIALDSFPYNGGTTSCEALWMGVPLVTLRGDRHVGRMGASILRRLDLDELVSETPKGYIDRAAALARDPERLAALRRGLRARMRTSPLCDAEGFARAIEAAYRRMWHRWCDEAARDG